MSKTSSAPISDFFSSALALSSRSFRSRSKLMRFSQSTAIDPYVLIAIYETLLFFQARHARQHLKHNREILLRQTHAARRRQHLIGGGRGRQRHIHLAAQFEREKHVLLHH